MFYRLRARSIFTSPRDSKVRSPGSPKSNPPHVVVDLSGVTFIDSSGLAVLIRAREDIRNYGGKLTLSGIREDVLVIFEMARLDQVFLIDPQNDLLAAD